MTFFTETNEEELPVDIEPVSVIVTELVTEKFDEVSPVIEDTIRNYDFEYGDLLPKGTWKF